MSDVKRYDLWPRLQFLPGGQQAEAVLCFEVKDDGQWVRYEDYARLKAEVERSRDQYNGIIDTQLKVIEELKAEVERLTEENDTRQRNMKLMFDDIQKTREAYHRLNFLYQGTKQGGQP